MRRKDGQKLNNTVFVEYISRDVADQVMALTTSSNFEFHDEKKKKRAIAKSKTASQEERWCRIKSAEEIIKAAEIANGAS